jgi:hypothetical protein
LPYGNWLFENLLAVSAEERDQESDEPELSSVAAAATSALNVDQLIDESNWRSQQINDGTRLPQFEDIDISVAGLSRITDNIYRSVATVEPAKLSTTVQQLKEHFRERERYNQDIHRL